MAGTATLSGLQTGTPEGSDSISLSLALGSVDEELQVVLASGANTINVPTGSNGVIVIPPASNTQSISVGGQAVGRTAAGWSLIQFDQTSPPATLTVTAGAAFSSPVTFKFF